MVYFLGRSGAFSRVSTTCLSFRAGLGNTEQASDSVFTGQSGSGPGVATVTEEQQQQFVQQMLQALANSNYGVSQCFLIILSSASLIDLNCFWIWNVTINNIFRPKADWKLLFAMLDSYYYHKRQVYDITCPWYWTYNGSALQSTTYLHTAPHLESNCIQFSSPEAQDLFTNSWSYYCC